MADVLPLTATTDPELHGAKAVSLARLARAGLPVPAGVVLVAGGRAEALREEYGRIGGGVVAVRASSAVEDGRVRSLAGMLPTVLGVSGADDVVRIAADVAGEAQRLTDRPCAVLVQRQVLPTWGGVAFTAHPVTGARHEVLVEGYRGLGDVVAAGTVIPEAAAVPLADALAEAGAVDATAGLVSSDAVFPVVARAVAAQALRAADVVGCPADVEWAVGTVDAQVAVWCLQARPITTLPG